RADVRADSGRGWRWQRRATPATAAGRITPRGVREMMRLPWFEYASPGSLAEAAQVLAREGASAMAIAGGTDLLPNMKRRQQAPRLLVSLRRIERLRAIGNAQGMSLGAGLTLSKIVALPAIRERYRALWQGASQVATEQLRNMGTLGGNL